MTLSFGSLFSGIGGLDKGLDDAGLECAWQCEIDKAAKSVLAKHWPNVPCYEDVKNVRRDNVSAVDLICGGFPCQDVSVAGKRAGLAGERSGLWFEFRRVVEELRPKWIVVENVPGLLSSNGGADFAIILRGLVECGYGVCWRILDAQYFGVAQRRRRVFIVGSLGDGRAAEVLFEREGLFGHPPARRTEGQGVAGTIAAGAHPGGFNGRDVDAGNVMVAKRLGNHHQRQDLDNDTYIVNEPQTFDWQAGVASGKDRVEIMDPPGRTRSLSASRSLAIYNIQHNDGGQHKRKDRPNGGLYVTETDTALTVGTTDLTAIAYGGNNTSGAIEIAAAVNAKGGSDRMDFESETFIAFTQNTRDEVRLISDDGKIAGALGAETGMHQTNYIAQIAQPLRSGRQYSDMGDGQANVVAIHETGQGFWQEDDIAGTLRAEGENRTSRPSNVISTALVPPTLSKESYSPMKSSSGQQADWAIGTTSGVRRLTPVECERLQGFPDGWTASGANGAQSDSVRYRQLGNAVCVNVARWLGERLAAQ